MLEKRAPDASTPPHHHGRPGEKPLHLAATTGQEKEGRAAPLQHGEDMILIEEAAASSGELLGIAPSARGPNNARSGR
jgi:hypothetical protein